VRALAVPSAAERAAAIARCAAWAASRGARFDALALGVDDAGNSSVRAAREIAAGEVVITIPRSLILSDADLGITPMREPRDTMSTWLAQEVERADSPWCPFLEVLPVQLPDVPMFRGGDELAPLAGTAARQWAAETHAEIVATYAAFDRSTRARVSLAGYAWARAIAQSRGFNAPHTTERRVAFIPIVDLMDHAPDETGWQYDLRRGEYVVGALRDFRAGDPVHFTYGHYGNAQLLLEYGFALPDNPQNETVLALGGAEPVLVRAQLDDLFVRALALATPAELGDAARARLPRIDPSTAAAEASTWEATCALVRRGERHTLEALVAFAAAVAAGETTDTPGLLRNYRLWQASNA
jgi:histone-lysine N-methyltransferase SETD3